MPISAMGKYIDKKSFFHGLDPRIKFSWVFLGSLVGILYSSFIPLLLILISTLPAIYLSKISKGALIAFLKFMASLGILAMIFWPIVVSEGSTVLFIIPLINRPYYLEGVIFGLLMVIRFISVAFPAVFFVTTTKTEDLVQSLTQSKVPYWLSFAIGSIIRFIPLLATEMETIREAQKARALELDKGNLVKKIWGAISILVPLFVCALRKVKYITIAMETRAFKIHGKRTVAKPIKFRFKQSIFLLPYIMLYTLLILSFPISGPWA